MKKSVKYFALTLGAFVLGMTMNNFAMSNIPSRVAVVDVNKVAAASAELKKANSDRTAKVNELKKFIQTAQTNIQKETDPKKKKDLEAKYTKELNAKKSAMNKEYSSKVSAVDKAVSALIAQKAKAGNYDVVLSKNIVLYGGTDITADVAKSVK